MITPGVMPAISPDGKRLAFAREPFGGGSAPYFYAAGCHQPGRTAAEFNVVVRDLRDGHAAGVTSSLLWEIDPSGHLVRSMAPGSALLRSGWCWRASLR